MDDYEEYDNFDDEILSNEEEYSSSDSEKSSSEESNESGTESDDSINSNISLDSKSSKTSEKNNKNYIKPKNYIGCEYLTKFEKTRILGVRAEQIACGAKIFIETSKTDPLEIAMEELHQRKIPLLIRRYFGKKYIDISVNSLIII
jgi:DNA-directed RNA polymerases I, II, and III subunit RPABC2